MFSVIHIASEVTYYLIFSVCVLSCFKASESNIPGLVYLRITLCSGMLTEISVLIAKAFALNGVIPYYLYIPLEYCMLVMFYISNTSKRSLKIAMFSSICVFFGIALLLITLKFDNLLYPAGIYNTSCLFNIVWLTILFFEMEVTEHVRLLAIPVFWVYSALMIFYGGIFFFNGAYNYINETDPELAQRLRTYINTGLNYVLYSVLTYSFLCSRKQLRNFLHST